MSLPRLTLGLSLQEAIVKEGLLMRATGAVMTAVLDEAGVSGTGKDCQTFVRRVASLADDTSLYGRMTVAWCDGLIVITRRATRRLFEEIADGGTQCISTTT